MESIAQTPAAASAIPPAHLELATRYVEAIIRHDPAQLLGRPFVEARTRELLDEFATSYVGITVGPYARHGADALRIALSRL